MAERDKPSDSPHDRRAFFRRGLSHILNPAAEYVSKRIPGVVPTEVRPLRPPGAMLEPDFLNTCYRCGSCADHCPADSITLLQVDDERLKGTPAIEPNRRACVVCDDLTCMKVCPSGALKLVDRTAIRIGLAVWDESTCLRSPNSIEPSREGQSRDADQSCDRKGAGQRSQDNQPGPDESNPTPKNCTICADVCPYGADAICIEAGRIRVIDPRVDGKGCTGCGVCQEQCPTRPKRAIRILPYALK